jgi:hypothetical protein
MKNDQAAARRRALTDLRTEIVKLGEKLRRDVLAPLRI